MILYLFNYVNANMGAGWFDWVKIDTMRVNRMNCGAIRMVELEKAIAIATEAHADQKDKAGESYIRHPLWVMEQMETDEEKIVAVLHDTVEDTGITLKKLTAEGFSTQIIEAVDCLTRRKGEIYMDFIRRLKPNALARKVKIADLKHNMDLGRVKELDEKMLSLQKRYKKTLAELMDSKDADG